MEKREKSGQNPSFGQGLELAGITQKAISNAIKKTGADLDRVQEVIGKPGVIFDFFESLFASEKKSILRLISDGANLKIGACTGKRTIANAEEVFKLHIDSNFENLGLNEPGISTGETLIDVCEITDDATFKQMFISLSTDLDKMVMSQDQIIEFCEQHSDWLRQDGYVTFFLIKGADGEYFVVSVRVYSEGLNVYVHSLEDGHVWPGQSRHRVVSPQLSTLSA